MKALLDIEIAKYHEIEPSNETIKNLFYWLDELGIKKCIQADSAKELGYLQDYEVLSISRRQWTMKNMTNSKVRALGKKELVKVFKELRIKDGLGDENISKNEFSYWYNKARDGQIGNYIIYEVISSESLYRADNSVIGREFYCQIDVFSIHSFESKKLVELVTKLENKLIEYGFEVELKEEMFESDTKLYHQIFYVSKLYI